MALHRSETASTVSNRRASSPGYATRRHPVGRQLDLAQFADIGGGQVGQRLADGHAAGSRRVEHGERGALAHGEGFAEVTLIAHRRHGDVGHRHLPRADHLVAGGHAADGTVADGDQEGLVGDGRQTHQAIGGILEFDGGGIEGDEGFRLMLDVARHARRLAEQRFHFHVDRIDAEMGVGHGQMAVASRFADDGERAALALAHGLEFGDAVRRNGQHVAFLRFVGPDFGRRHARLFGRHLAQIEHGADAARVGQFRQGVGNATGADVVHRQDRIVLAHLPAAVDDFLRAALDFRVAALDRGEVEVFGVGTGRHRRGGAAAQADQHAGAAELDELACRPGRFLP